VERERERERERNLSQSCIIHSGAKRAAQIRLISRMRYSRKLCPAAQSLPLLAGAKLNSIFAPPQQPGQRDCLCTLARSLAPFSFESKRTESRCALGRPASSPAPLSRSASWANNISQMTFLPGLFQLELNSLLPLQFGAGQARAHALENRPPAA